ncbi:MAG: type II toxin-antitoxin system VapC family toxin [Mycobacterium sp.]|nr:type II toxin-antitoxin system VapC family toxin [Mycobacterium sp.]
MLLCDTNVWLALALSGHAHHNVSRAWLDEIDEPGVIHFCRATQQSFLRLLTNRTVLGAYGSPPLTNAEAWVAYAAFLDDDRIVMANREPDGLEVQWKAFAVRQSPAPKVWMDAYLAAFALTGGFELVTTDADFTQYRGIGLRLLTQQVEDTIYGRSRKASRKNP